MILSREAQEGFCGLEDAYCVDEVIIARLAPDVALASVEDTTIDMMAIIPHHSSKSPFRLQHELLRTEYSYLLSSMVMLTL